MKPQFHISGFIFSKFLSGQQNLRLKIAIASIGEVWICYLKLQKARYETKPTELETTMF